MKTLLVLRHAKSSWKHPDLPDHDRPLKRRGKSDIPRLARHLRENDLVPDLILCSTARRASETGERLARSGEFECPIELMEEIYLAEPAVLLRILRGVSERPKRLLLVGHNPGLEELVAALTGAEVALPTAAVARIELDIERWRQIEPQSGRLAGVWRPKEPAVDEGTGPPLKAPPPRRR